MEQPVYNFLGYTLHEVKFKNDFKPNTYVGISIPQDQFNKKNNQYSMYIRISTDFSNEESYFVFYSVFQINDLNWFNGIPDDNTKKSIFFAIVFPFIREKIFSITSDSNLGLFIPTIDVRMIDFSKELRLIKTPEKR